MTSDPDEFPDDDANEDVSTHRADSDLWLADNYPKLLGIRGLPSEYLKFTIDSPFLVDALSDDLLQMSELRANACYTEVVETITDHMGGDPEFKALVFAPEHDSREERLNSHLTSFLIAHDLDENMLRPNEPAPLAEDAQLIIDADVAAIIESPEGTTEENMEFLNPDLLEYDYLTLCQALDGVIYSESATGRLTADSFATHLVSDLSLRLELLTENPSFYEDIYTPTVEPMLNEHHNIYY